MRDNKMLQLDNPKDKQNDSYPNSPGEKRLGSIVSRNF